MTMTVSIHIEHKNKNATAHQRRHDLRTEIPKNADPDRIKFNTTIITPQYAGSLQKQCVALRAARTDTKRKMKSDAAVATRGIISFGVLAQPIINALPVDEQDRLYLEAARAVCEVMGWEPTGLVAHRDEYAPHAHFQLPAYTRDGRPNSQVIKKEHTIKMQDAAGSVYEHLEIHRGTPREEREASGGSWIETHHRSVRQLHADLPREIAAAKAQRDAIRVDIARLAAEHAETMQERSDTYTSVQSVIDDMYAELAHTKSTVVSDTENLLATYCEKEKMLHTEYKTIENKKRGAEQALAYARAAIAATTAEANLGVSTLRDIRLDTKILIEQRDAIRAEYDAIKTKLLGATDASVAALFDTHTHTPTPALIQPSHEQPYAGARFESPSW